MLRKIEVKYLHKNNQLPRHEFDLVLSHILKCSRPQIYSDNYHLSISQYLRFKHIAKHRLKGEPLQYLLGEIEFYGLPFKLNRHSFIPRPETEILVDTIVSKYKFYQSKLKILDLCTGSGNIAISLIKNLANCEIYASDISSRALTLARKNARLNNLDSEITFIKSDLFAEIEGKFDIMAINPPYIPTQEIDNLSKELAYEPRISLDGGIDGLDFYYRIFDEIPKFMSDGCVAFIEIEDSQVEPLKKLLASDEHLKLSQIINDYNNRCRVIEIEKA